MNVQNEQGDVKKNYAFGTGRLPSGKPSQKKKHFFKVLKSILAGGSPPRIRTMPEIK